MEMFGSVLVLGRVAAAHVSTYETEAQLDPGISHFQALFAAFGARRDLLYLIKMRACLCHVLFLPEACVDSGQLSYFLL
jgi:hypothetical protein